MRLRNSVKAVIVREGKVLLTKCLDGDGDFYLLPGGGQEPGETMAETLRRECIEEISCDIEMGQLLFIREYRAQNHQFASFDPQNHQIEFMFQCVLAPGAQPQNGAVPDSMQVGVEWVALEDLAGITLYPSGLKAAIPNPDSVPIYWGDVN